MKSTNTVDSDLYFRSEHLRRVAKKIFPLNSFVSKTPLVQSLVSRLFVLYVTQTFVDVELTVGL